MEKDRPAGMSEISLDDKCAPGAATTRRGQGPTMNRPGARGAALAAARAGGGRAR